jgi:hypothetical protein
MNKLESETVLNILTLLLQENQAERLAWDLISEKRQNEIKKDIEGLLFDYYTQKSSQLKLL